MMDNMRAGMMAGAARIPLRLLVWDYRPLLDMSIDFQTDFNGGAR